MCSHTIPGNLGVLQLLHYKLYTRVYFCIALLCVSVWRDPKSERYRFRDFFSVPKFSETGSETFFGTKKIRDRFWDFFRYQIFFETGSDTFFGTKKNRDRFRDFFRYQIFFETDSDTIKKRQKSRERDETETKTTKFKSGSGTFWYQICFATKQLLTLFYVIWKP